MSREERRQYERMMKNMDRGPALPPAARARAERNAERRARRRTSAAPPGSFTRGYIIRTVLIAFVVGYLAFSIQWPQMPFALYVGIAAAVVAAVLMVGFKLLQRRLPTPPTS